MDYELPDFATKFTKNISKKRGISKVFLAFFVVVWYNILVGIYAYKGEDYVCRAV